MLKKNTMKRFDKPVIKTRGEVINRPSPRVAFIIKPPRFVLVNENIDDDDDSKEKS